MLKCGVFQPFLDLESETHPSKRQLFLTFLLSSIYSHSKIASHMLYIEVPTFHPCAVWESSIIHFVKRMRLFIMYCKHNSRSSVFCNLQNLKIPHKEKGRLQGTELYYIHFEYICPCIMACVPFDQEVMGSNPNGDDSLFCWGRYMPSEDYWKYYQRNRCLTLHNQCNGWHLLSWFQADKKILSITYLTLMRSVSVVPLLSPLQSRFWCQDWNTIAEKWQEKHMELVTTL